MFERLTKDARAVIEGAVAHARSGGARTVDAEHALLALLDSEGSRASFALSALGLGKSRDAVREAVGEARRRAGLTRADADALAGLGIDVGGDRGSGGGGARGRGDGRGCGEPGVVGWGPAQVRAGGQGCAGAGVAGGSRAGGAVCGG